ncbi:MAG: translesion error-prone DNA polymerase V autoproteolytic subunit [Burkholderiales bacterium]|nr:translesion error-prone DNA polymerase V autoproteolytic subunit [Burkholderiales bacterium]
MPYLDFSVQAGFPSPAEAYIKEKVDLNQLLVGVPAATFLLRASGNSMVSAGISDGDLLVLDRSKEPRHGDIVIMRVNDDFTVKRLYNKDGVLKLEAESPDPAYTDIYPGENDEWVAVGVVTYVIKQV